jgi:hypothetical protein
MVMVGSKSKESCVGWMGEEVMVCVGEDEMAMV